MACLLQSLSPMTFVLICLFPLVNGYIICMVGTTFRPYSYQATDFDISTVQFVNQVDGGVLFQATITNTPTQTHPASTFYTNNPGSAASYIFNYACLYTRYESTMSIGPHSTPFFERQENGINVNGDGRGGMFPSFDYYTNSNFTPSWTGVAGAQNLYLARDCSVTLPWIVIANPIYGNQKTYAWEERGVTYLSQTPTGTLCRAQWNDWRYLESLRLVYLSPRVRKFHPGADRWVTYNLESPVFTKKYRTPVTGGLGRWDDKNMNVIMTLEDLNLVGDSILIGMIDYQWNAHLMDCNATRFQNGRMACLQGNSTMISNWLNKCLGVPDETGCENDVLPETVDLGESFSAISKCWEFGICNFENTEVQKSFRSCKRC